MVLPWKLPLNDTKCVFCDGIEGSAEEAVERARPTLRANFRAASVASEPELDMKAREEVDMPPEAWVRETRREQRAPVQGLW